MANLLCGPSRSTTDGIYPADPSRTESVRMRIPKVWNVRQLLEDDRRHVASSAVAAPLEVHVTTEGGNGILAAFIQGGFTFAAGLFVLGAAYIAYLGVKQNLDLQKHDLEQQKKQFEDQLGQQRAQFLDQKERQRAQFLDQKEQQIKRELRDRYTAAGLQLASEAPPIRIAGVYALRSLADDWHEIPDDDERDACINLLRAYLRVPFVGVPGSTPDDREVRQTIVRIIAERRQMSTDKKESWAKVKLVHMQRSWLVGTQFRDADLHSVDLTDADLTDADLTRTNLTDAILLRTNLTRSDLIATNLSNVDLTTAILTKATIANVISDNKTHWPSTQNQQEEEGNQAEPPGSSA